jgi:hypothetical protein
MADADMREMVADLPAPEFESPAFTAPPRPEPCSGRHDPDGPGRPALRAHLLPRADEPAVDRRARSQTFHLALRDR